jgi:hypothetical protein
MSSLPSYRWTYRGRMRGLHRPNEALTSQTHSNPDSARYERSVIAMFRNRSAGRAACTQGFDLEAGRPEERNERGRRICPWLTQLARAVLRGESGWKATVGKRRRQQAALNGNRATQGQSLRPRTIFNCILRAQQQARRFKVSGCVAAGSRPRTAHMTGRGVV